MDIKTIEEFDQHIRPGDTLTSSNRSYDIKVVSFTLNRDTFKGDRGHGPAGYMKCDGDTNKWYWILDKTVEVEQKTVDTTCICTPYDIFHIGCPTANGRPCRSRE